MAIGKDAGRERQHAQLALHLILGEPARPAAHGVGGIDQGGGGLRCLLRGYVPCRCGAVAVHCEGQHALALRAIRPIQAPSIEHIVPGFFGGGKGNVGAVRVGAAERRNAIARAVGI